MLRDGHVRVTCGADQQPPAFLKYPFKSCIMLNFTAFWVILIAEGEEFYAKH